MLLAGPFLFVIDCRLSNYIKTSRQLLNDFLIDDFQFLYIIVKDMKSVSRIIVQMATLL
jgi:Holliday junction resolvase RusA-like endonuclease